MDPTLETLTTVGGLALAVTIICEIIIRALSWAGEQKDRFGPLLAAAIGIVVSVLASLALNLGTASDLGQAILTGLFAGASAMGIHDIVAGPVAKTLSPNT